jgi:hypothetical protein
MTITSYDSTLAAGELYADVARVIPGLRTIYAQAKAYKALTASFSSEQAFQDAFDVITLLDEDYGAIPSQMIYEINQLITAWEGNAAKRLVLGLPPA